MDGMRFDAMARNLSAIRSRRESVKAAAAASLGIGLASLGLAQADAKKKKKRCKRLLTPCNPEGKRKCCDGLTCSTRFQDDDFQCRKGFGAACASGEECAGTTFCISGECVLDLPVPSP